MKTGLKISLFFLMSFFFVKCEPPNLGQAQQGTLFKSSAAITHLLSNDSWWLRINPVEDMNPVGDASSCNFIDFKITADFYECGCTLVGTFSRVIRFNYNGLIQAGSNWTLDTDGFLGYQGHPSLGAGVQLNDAEGSWLFRLPDSPTNDYEYVRLRGEISVSGSGCAVYKDIAKFNMPMTHNNIDYSSSPSVEQSIDLWSTIGGQLKKDFFEGDIFNNHESIYVKNTCVASCL